MTTEVEAGNIPRFLCTTPDHVQRSLVCTRAAKGYTNLDIHRVKQLPAGGVTTEHEWTPLEKVIESKAVEAGKQPGEATNYVETHILLNSGRYYCQLYDHVMSRQSCAISGYINLPKAEGLHDGDAFVRGRRSPYVRYVPSPAVGKALKSYAQQVAENIVGEETPEEFDKAMENGTPVDVDVQLDRVTTGEYLHGKDNGKVFTAPTQPPKKIVPFTVEQYAGTMSPARQLEAGDWVLVRGQVKNIGTTKVGDYIDVEFPTVSGDKRVLAVVPSEVACYTLPPVPPEPHQNNLLVSKASGRVFQYSDNSGDWVAGWHDAGVVNAERLSWKTLWEEHGPFQEYYASRPLNGNRS